METKREKSSANTKTGHWWNKEEMEKSATRAKLKANIGWIPKMRV